MNLRSIRPHNSSPQTPNSTIMITMTVTRHDHLARPSISFLYHNLMPNPPSCRVKVHIVLLGKRLDFGVFLDICLRLVLHVVVEREDGLARILYGLAREREELGDDGSGVVVCHPAV